VDGIGFEPIRANYHISGMPSNSFDFIHPLFDSTKISLYFDTTKFFENFFIYFVVGAGFVPHLAGTIDPPLFI
jgi:hypothetical protein